MGDETRPPLSCFLTVCFSSHFCVSLSPSLIQVLASALICTLSCAHVGTICTTPGYEPKLRRVRSGQELRFSSFMSYCRWQCAWISLRTNTAFSLLSQSAENPIKVNVYNCQVRCCHVQVKIKPLSISYTVLFR